MKYQWTEEQKALQAKAAAYAQKTLDPIAHEIDRTAVFPEAALKEMAASGLLGLTVPPEFGGKGESFLGAALALEELAKSSGAAAAIAATHNVLAADVVARYGTAEQKKKYLGALAKGEIIGGYALAEPGAALASGEDKMRVKKTEDGQYRLSGKKWITANGGVADVYVVVGQTDEAVGQKGINLFLVDRADARVLRAVDKLGLRAFPTTEIELKEAPGSLLGEEAFGEGLLKELQARETVAFGALAVGVGRAALEQTTKHATTRIQFGQPIGKLQAVQWMLADIASELHMLRLGVYHAARSIDRADDYVQEAALFKAFAVKAAGIIGMNAIQVHGGVGYSRDHDIERFARDLQGAFIVENMNEYPQNIIAKQLLK